MAELKSFDTVQLMPRTTVYGVYDQGTYGAVERVNDHVAVPPEHQPRQRGWRIVARAVLAAGAIERGLAFADNDRPGMMLASGVRSYVNRFGVAPGKRAVVFATWDDGWSTAETSPMRASSSRRWSMRARARRFGSILGGSFPGRGGARLRRPPPPLGDHPSQERRTSRVPCDLLAIANGWNPTLHLTCHLGGRPIWDRSDQVPSFPARCRPA